MDQFRPEPGLGASADQLAGILSGLGDMLVLFALCLERVGLNHDELVDLLEEATDRMAEEPPRDLVPRALLSVVESWSEGPPDRSRRVRFSVIEGGGKIG